MSERRPEGVNIAGYFRAEVGVGEAGRLMVGVLKKAGIPYSVVPFADVPSRQDSPFSDWGAGEPHYDTNLICVNADALPAFVRDVGEEFFEDRYSIGMWWWEVEEFPASMRPMADLLDEVWVGSRHAADAIAPVISKPVLICPLPIVPPRPKKMTRAELGLPKGFVFLFCFDFNSILERKNPLGVIRAFSRAFEPGEGPTLVLKSVNGYQHPPKLEGIRAATNGRSDIVVMDRYLDIDALHALVSSADAYVSLHRAEGFGLTMAEAMALGKPVVATAYGGNLEFMDDRTGWLVPYELTKIPPGCEPYPAGSRWAEPDLDAAAAMLREIYDDREAAAAKGAAAREHVLAQHSTTARAQFVRRRLETIRGARTTTRVSPGTVAVASGTSLPPSPDLRQLTVSADGLGGGAVGAVRRVLYRLLFPLLHRQSEYNLATAQQVNALATTVERQRDELLRLSDRLALAEDARLERDDSIELESRA